MQKIYIYRFYRKSHGSQLFKILQLASTFSGFQHFVSEIDQTQS